MPRAHSPGGRSDGSDGEDQGQEVEYNRLLRSYRVMENEKEAYTQESHSTIRKQQMEIEQLEAERLNSLKELRLAESRQNKIRDDMNTGKLISLSGETDEKRSAIDSELSAISELEAEIRGYERKVKDNAKKMGGNTGSDLYLKTQKQIRVLENRLDQATLRFNNMLTHNRSMREVIDDLRFERSKYEHLRVKLEKELETLRAETGAVIESSSQSYEARDDAQQKMLMLKEKADKDKQQHETEMKELCRVLDHDKKLKEFMGVKCQDRPEDTQLVIWRLRKEAREEEKKKESQEDTVDSFEHAKQQILELSGGEDNLDVIRERFMEMEDRNFAIFTYVNEQNNTIETLREKNDAVGNDTSVKQIKADIEKFEGQGSKIKEERKEILHKLESKHHSTKTEADESEQYNTKIMKILDQLRAGIETQFTKIQCDRGPIKDMLGASEGVTNENMIQYLGIIEQRTNEILAVQAYLKYKEDDFDSAALAPLAPGHSTLHGPQSTALSGPPGTVTLPSLGDQYEASDAEDDDDETKPMTRDILKVKANKTAVKRDVHKKEKSTFGDPSPKSTKVGGKR